ncbi:MAG TPA: S8 family serine peptidase, partial [Longimicrobiales bacterium]
GRILAVAAGNSGVNANESPAFVRTPIHAGGRLASGGRDGFDIVVPQYAPSAGPSNDGAILDFWYDGRDSLTLVITSPNGRQVRVATGDTLALDGPDGYLAIDNAHAGRNPNNGDREAVIALVDWEATHTPAVGRWHVEVQGSAVAGSGRWDLWLVGSTLRNATQLTAFDGPAVRNATLVSSPGTATRAITVAAYAGRHQWQGPGAAAQAYPFQEKLGDIGFFSAPGPRRDGVLKPDIAAPGKVVVSSMSRGASTWSALPTFVEADSVHAVLMGTSMATPFVAGAAALLLQLRPTLTPEALRSLLTASARQDAFTVHPYTGAGDGVPNAQWGFGKLDVAAAVHALAPPAGSLRVEVTPSARPGTPASATGTRLELLRLTLSADSAEAEQVTQLGFDVTGRDSAAWLLVVRDSNGDGVADLAEPVVARVPLYLDGTTSHVRVPGPIVPAGMRRDYIVALELGAGVPNGAHFSASYRPADLSARGTLSAVQRVTAPTTTVASPLRATTVLLGGEALNLSQNPVRSSPLVINYAERPRAVLVYSLTGARVRTLAGSDLEDGRAVWSLDNDRGHPVANGLYLLVVDAPSGRLLRKIIVAR